MTLLGALDSMRIAVLRAGRPWVAPLVVDRQRRVWWLGVISVVSAFVMTLVAPLLSVSWGPVLLGVPHLLSDVRYLVLRERLHREWLWWGLAVTPLVVAPFVGGPAVSLLTLAATIALSPGSMWRRVELMLIWVLLTILAVRFTYQFQYAFLHLHNLVALWLWWQVRERPRSHAVIPLLAVTCAALLLLGVADPLIAVFAGWYSLGGRFSFGALVEELAPWSEPTLAARWFLSFAFLQSVHYAVWLRLMPDDARERPAPRSFRESFRALAREFSGPVLAAVGVGALVLLVWGVRDVQQARWGYLNVAGFHGYLELAVAARWLMREGR